MSDAKRLDDLRSDRQQLTQIGRQTAQQAGQSVEQYFQANKGALARFSPYISQERLLQVAKTAIRVSPTLAQCTVKSLFGAVILCAMMGLEPNTHEGLCFLIPRKRSRPAKDPRGRVMKDDNGQTIWQTTWEVNVQIGYRGHIALAYRSPRVKAIRTAIIHEGDKYRIVEGSTPRIEHEPSLHGERGDPIVYYATVRLDTGETLFEWMTTEEIDRHRRTYSDSFRAAEADLESAKLELERARTTNQQAAAQRKIDKAASAAWIRDFDAMARKTLVNRIKSYIPTSHDPQVREAQELAATLDDTGFRQRPEGVIDGEDAYETEASDDEGEETATSTLRVTQETGGPTIDQVMPRRTEPAETVTDLRPRKTEPEVKAKAEPTRTETARTETARTETETAAPVTTEVAKTGTPAADLGGELPWYTPLNLTSRAQRAVRQSGTTGLADALQRPKEFWIGLDGVGETAYQQLRASLEAAWTKTTGLPIPQPPATTAPAAAAVTEDEAAGFGRDFE